ncbi:tau 95 subunit of transcription factor TFIIIC [Malassezia sp. CBS 17886]|nr:tau 95 subunit of transcription factor TFIIIC [Malassezia sp. CBS 17886]
MGRDMSDGRGRVHADGTVAGGAARGASSGVRPRGRGDTGPRTDATAPDSPAPGASESAPVWKLPAARFVVVEYPGIVQGSAASLECALATLYPHADAGMSRPSMHAALEHLATLFARGGRLVECRLAQDDGGGDAMDVYRHPLLGDVVDGCALAARIRRRVWRSRLSGETRKEYCVEILGAVRTFVRFRRMADFAFRPDMPAGARSGETHPTLQLHRSLVRLDIAAMRNYRLEPELEDYGVDAEPSGTRSRLGMIPPPFFSRMELPFAYNYRQNPASSLRTMPFSSTAKRHRRTARKGEGDAEATARDASVVTRYINRSRWRNLAPVAIKFGDAGDVPARPEASLTQMPQSARQQALLAQLQERLDERPVWSRLALLNQFSAADARVLIQSKEMFSLVAYTFGDGPWRDTLVRFGYDPRRDKASRFLQRIHLRGKSPRVPATRGAFKSEYGDVAQSSSALRPPASVSSAAHELRAPTHIFDGNDASLASSTFQLCDITHPAIAPLIAVDGPGDIRMQPDSTCGWYSATAWDAIRGTISQQFHALLSASVSDRGGGDERGAEESEEQSEEEG